jgi:hypothetical protein
MFCAWATDIALVRCGQHGCYSSRSREELIDTVIRAVGRDPEELPEAAYKMGLRKHDMPLRVATQHSNGL